MAETAVGVASLLVAALRRVHGVEVVWQSASLVLATHGGAEGFGGSARGGGTGAVEDGRGAGARLLVGRGVPGGACVAPLFDGCCSCCPSALVRSGGHVVFCSAVKY